MAKISRLEWLLGVFVVIAIIVIATNTNSVKIKPIEVNWKYNASINKTHTYSGFPYYPDPAYTWGDVLETNKSIICVSGYSATVRDVSQKDKENINILYKRYFVSGEYNLTDSKEYDHMIPLSIGGSNDLTNLWIEMEYPKPGFKEKDRVENYLHRKVCNGNMSVEEAQYLIITDWISVYNMMNETVPQDLNS